MEMDFKNMDDFELWKYGYGKLPSDFNSIEDVDAFYEPILEAMNEKVAIEQSYLKSHHIELKSHVEWERDSLIERKELLRNLLNPFYVRVPKESKKCKSFFIYPIKAQAKAEFEEWLKQQEYKLETGQELKREKGSE